VAGVYSPINTCQVCLIHINLNKGKNLNININISSI